MKVPSERYDRDVMGMPCYAAEENLVIVVTSEDSANAMAQDDENCAIALGCKRQLQSPYVSVGRSRTDVAMPHPNGVLKPDFGTTLWAVLRYRNSLSARKIIVAADTGSLDADGAVVELLSPMNRMRPVGRKKENKRHNRKLRGAGKKREVDELTEMGVRILTGQRRR